MKIGTDIVQIDRFKQSLDRFGNKFLDRFLNASEISLSNKVESYAGYWAAKEAISKALGCGIGKELSFKDITISKTLNGVPYFRLSQTAQLHFQVTSSSLSISHDGGFAIAVVAITQKEII
jgi:holo-[acyl-carrier protein] synthase